MLITPQPFYPLIVVAVLLLLVFSSVLEVSLIQKLVKKSGVAETKMESIALLNDVPLLVPRGRYEIDIGRRALKFHGKSYDYTILYTNINRYVSILALHHERAS